MKKLIFLFIGISAFTFLLGSCAPKSSTHSGPVAYTSQAGVNAPDGIAIDASGYVWVLGQAGDLAEINSRGTVLNTYQLPPNSTTGYTSYAGIAIAASGNIWAVNYAGNFVAQIVPSTGVITKYLTGYFPYGVAIDPSGNIWVGDTGTGSTPYSSLTEWVGSTSYPSSYGSPVSQNCVESVVIDGLGYVWLSGCGSVYIVKASSGVSTGSFVFPSGGPGNIAIDQNENAWTVDIDSLYFMSPPNKPVLMYSASGADFKGIAIDQAGNVWVTDNANATLLKFNPSGTLLAAFAVGNGPSGIAIDAYGDVWVTNTGDNTVTEWMGIAAGPQFFPYTGPQFPGGQP